MAAFTPAATVINKLTAKVCSPSPSTLFTDVAAAATFSLHPLVQSTTLQRTPQRQGMMDADAVALINPNPVVHERKARAPRQTPPQQLLAAAASTAAGDDDIDDAADGPCCSGRELIDAAEVFDHIRDITDPEHPYSLEQLNVVEEQLVLVDDPGGHVRVMFTPTVAHCSMATLIGLCIRTKLLRCLPPRFKVDIQLTPGSHSTEAAVNKQLNDKERVAAALENPALLDMVNRCLAAPGDGGAAPLADSIAGLQG